MHHVSGIQTEIPSVPMGDGSAQALPIVIITLIVALVGGAIIYALGRKRSCLLRLIAVVVFTLFVAAGLLLSLWIAYNPTNGWIPQ